MNRLGFRTEHAGAALQRLRALRFAPAELRLLTHLARADERTEPATQGADRTLPCVVTHGLQSAHQHLQLGGYLLGGPSDCGGTGCGRALLCMASRPFAASDGQTELGGRNR